MNKYKKMVLLALGIICVAISLIGFSYANEKVESSIENNLYTPTVETSITEKFDKDTAKVQWPGSVDKVVEVKNNGTAPVFVRIAYTEFWKIDNDEFLPNYIDGVEIAKKVWTNAFKFEEWVDGKDGWYYYKKVLNPSDSTSQILTKVEFDAKPLDTRYEKAKYHLEFRIEVVQASKDNAVNQQATSQLFKKTGEVSTEGVVTWQ